MTLAYRWTESVRGRFEAPGGAFRQDYEGVRLPYPITCRFRWRRVGRALTLLLLGWQARPSSSWTGPEEAQIAA